MKKLVLIVLSSSLMGCLSNRALNALGNSMETYGTMQYQHELQMEQIRASQAQNINQATLFIYSDPQGALISEINATGNSPATAPAKSVYDGAMIKNHTDINGCFIVNGFIATWADGTRKSTERTVKMCQGLRNDYQITIKR